MLTIPIDDIQINSIGGLLLSILIEIQQQPSKIMSGWVGSYGCHLPNIDNYKTLAVYHIDGMFMFAYDSNFNLIVNNLDMEHEQSRNFFKDIESKINDLKNDKVKK